MRVFVETQRRDAYYRNDPSKYGLVRNNSLRLHMDANSLCLVWRTSRLFVFVMRNSSNFEFQRQGSLDRVHVVPKLFLKNANFDETHQRTDRFWFRFLSVGSIFCPG